MSSNHKFLLLKRLILQRKPQVLIKNCNFLEPEMSFLDELQRGSGMDDDWTEGKRVQMPHQRWKWEPEKDKDSNVREKTRDSFNRCLKRIS